MTRWKTLMIAGLATLALALPVQPLSSPADARGGGHGGGGHGGGHHGGGGGHRGGGGHFGRGGHGGVHIRIGVRGGGRGGYRRGGGWRGGGWHGGYGGYRVVRACPWHHHWSWRFGRCVRNF